MLKLKMLTLIAEGRVSFSNSAEYFSFGFTLPESLYCLLVFVQCFKFLNIFLNIDSNLILFSLKV